MTPQEIMDGLQAKNRELTRLNDEYLELQQDYAEKKRLYAISYAKKIIELRVNGSPATGAPDIARGDEIVSLDRLNKDLADSLVNTCREKIKDIRSAIDSYRSILTWLRAEKTNP